MSTGDGSIGDRHAVAQRMAARTLIAAKSAVSVAELIARSAADIDAPESKTLKMIVEQLEQVERALVAFVDLPPHLQRSGQVAAAAVTLLISQLRVIIPHETSVSDA